jgi:hypothetical protein
MAGVAANVTDRAIANGLLLGLALGMLTVLIALGLIGMRP